MSANNTFQHVNEQGWKRGLSNLLRAEMGNWWKTNTWWVQALIWTGVINMTIASVVWGAAENAPEGVALYVLFSCLFPTIAVIIILQDAVIGEKESGTAAWILSKPLSRTAFIVAKLIAHSINIFVSMTLLPGVAAYIQISLAGGEWLSPLNFIAGMMGIWLYLLFFLTLTLMLGVLYDQRGAVIGIPLTIAFGSQMLLSLLPFLNFILPWRLAAGVENESHSVIEAIILGVAPFSWMPVLSVSAFIGIFIFIAIRKFQIEEF